MERVPLAIVGCGGMGGRHLLGLRELDDSGLRNVELVAVCDLRRENAEYLADNAERLLGWRPLVFEDLASMAAELPQLQAVDITTEAGAHCQVACAALELGLHVLCEKPLALTIRGCNRIIQAQRRSGHLLSVAENFRRDPICRLTKALLTAGVIGEPYLLFDIGVGGGNRIIITPWRHDKRMGGIVVDTGVHNADLMQYYLGHVREVYAKTRRWEPVRYKSATRISVSEFYERWNREFPDAIEATAEDTLIAVLSFESGAIGQWTSFQAAHGEGFGRMAIYGSQGSLRSAGARNGRPLTLHLTDGGEVEEEAILDLVPDFHLDELTARLFGADRLTSYPFAFPEADRKLLAIEYHELGECILAGRQPEVDALVGRKALALCHAAFESSLLNRPVSLAEIEAEQTGVYEAEINEYWGLGDPDSGNG